ncbi:MAG: UbiX family flavin prenyltransferase [Dehalococcoidia bacterium]
MASVIVGITGGSGVIISKKVIDLLLDNGISVEMVCSNAAKQVWMQEMKEPISEAINEWNQNPNFKHYAINQIGAPIASGTHNVKGMIIVPCSMSTAASIAHGLSDNLIRRAADVTIKEGRPLTIMARETPLSVIHLKNLQALAEIGVTVQVPAPAFYLDPKSVDDITDYLARKAITSFVPQEGLLSENFEYKQGIDEA